MLLLRLTPLATALAVVSGTVVSKVCPRGKWVTNNDDKQDPYCYFAPNARRNFTRAIKFCKKRGGNLPSIPGESVHLFVSRILTQRQNGRNVEVEGWIALRGPKGGSFAWTDGFNGTYENWWAGKAPSLAHSELCAKVNTGPNGKWGSDNCSNRRRFVCKRLATNRTQPWPSSRG